MRHSVNIYRNAREASPYTQESAAEKIGVSPRYLQRVEAIEYTGKVDDVIVIKMAKVYGTPWLGIDHLQRNVIASEIVPEINPTDIRGAAANIYNVEYLMGIVKPIVMSIAIDGKVNPWEQQSWDTVVEKVTQAVKLLYEAMYCYTGIDTTTDQEE